MEIVHSLLTEQLHVKHLRAVIGFSMGAQQAFQWAVSYPTECGHPAFPQLDARQALSYQAAVIAYTVGWVAYEQSQAMHDFLTQLSDFDESFETGLQAMVSGFTGR